jgi:hypothetical protein
VPELVTAELGAGGSTAPDLASHEWLIIKRVSLPDSIRMVPDLGSGEAGTIALCLASPNPLALLDDGLARRIARLHGIPMTGTAGVLLKSKALGHIHAVRPILADMIEAGFYLRPDHLELICRMAGEESA